MKWDTISLGDIALQRGGSVDPKKHPDEVFELYSIPAFDAGAPEVTIGSAIGSSKKAVQRNDVMISRIVPHIRRACVVGAPNGHRQIASGEWIIFRDESIWPQYLRWVLVGDVFHSAFMRTVSGVGGSLLRARPAEVFKIHIPLPPLPEQKRIAGILDAADSLRAKRRDSLAQLDTLIQSTFLDMFGDPVTNPMGWEVVAGAEVFEDLTYGTSTKSSDTAGPESIPVLRIPNIIGGQINWSNLKFTEPTEKEIAKLALQRDDLLFVRSNGNPDYIGRCARFEAAPSGKCLFASYLIRGRIRPSVRITAEYLKQHIELRTYRHEVRREARTTAGNFNLSTAGIRKFRFTRPPVDLQHRFAGIVESVERQKASQRAHLAELDTLFAALQSRAFRGDL